jgi:RHS repeat-associated protein
VKADGSVVEAFEYDSFGQPAHYLLGAESSDNPFLWKGQHWDYETELYYVRYRYYSPALGRFMTQDVIGPYGDIINVGNAYVYAGNSPLSINDLYGLQGGAAQGFIDFWRGFGDTVSFGATRIIREAIWGEGGKVLSPGAYAVGEYAGIADGLAIGGAVAGSLRSGARQAGKEAAEQAAKETAEGVAKEAAENAAKQATEKATQEAAEQAARGSAEKTARERAQKASRSKGNPKPSPKFQTPTNPPQCPPATIPAGWRVRRMPPTEQYPNGYWRLEKPMKDGSWQPIDPSTMKPGSPAQTHIPLPPSGG